MQYAPVDESRASNLLLCDDWARALSQVEALPRRKRRQGLASVFGQLKADEIATFVAATTGSLLSAAELERLEMGPEVIFQAFARVTGLSESHLRHCCVDAEGLPELAVALLKSPAQPSRMSLAHLHESLLGVLSYIRDPQQLLVDLMKQLEPMTVRYILRMLEGAWPLPTDVGTVLEALSLASGLEMEAIQASYTLTHQLEDTAERALKGRRALAQVHCRTGRPYVFMPVSHAYNLNGLLSEDRLPVLVDPQLPGIRVQIHRRHAMVHLYSERLQDVSRAFPEVVSALEKSLTGTDDLILEGYVYQPDVNALTSMTTVQQRLGMLPGKRQEPLRPQSILAVVVTELIRQGREDLMPRPYLERRRRIKQVLKAVEGVSTLAEHEVSTPAQASEVIERLAKSGLTQVMVRPSASAYEPGRADICQRLVVGEPTACLMVTGASVASNGQPSRLQLSCLTHGQLTSAGDLAASSVDRNQWKALLDRAERYKVAGNDDRWVMRQGLVLEVTVRSARTSPRRPSGVTLVGMQLYAVREDRGLEQVEQSSRLVRLAEDMEREIFLNTPLAVSA